MPANSFRALAFFLIALLIGLVYALVQAITGPGSLTQIPAENLSNQNLQDNYSSDITVYFTDPSSNQNRGGPDVALAAAIDMAQFSVDIAAHELNLWSIRDALINAHQRGVNIRVVAETDNWSRELDQLVDAGVQAVKDTNPSLMHNKFVVIDHLIVWSGSMNYTLNGAYRHNNNLIRLRDAELAAAYTAEFEEMFLEGIFGNHSPTGKGLETHLAIVYFSPDDGVEDEILTLIQSARESIIFMAFSFTSDPLAEAILDAAHAGIKVQGVMDKEQALTNTGGEYSHFIDSGLDVRLDNNPDKMHHKVIIIDNEILITGSYNFSKSADTRNDENLLIIRDPSAIAAYLDEFNQLFNK